MTVFHIGCVARFMRNPSKPISYSNHYTCRLDSLSRRGSINGLSKASNSKLETFRVLHPRISFLLKKMQTSENAKHNESDPLKSARNDEKLTSQVAHSSRKQSSPEIIGGVTGVFTKRNLCSSEYDGLV
jgi:hypothetical protein